MIPARYIMRNTLSYQDQLSPYRQAPVFPFPCAAVYTVGRNYVGRTVMKTIEEYYAIAKDIFLEAHPDLKHGIENLTEEQAATMGMTVSQLQALQKDRAYAAYVREKKLDGMLFAIQLAEPDKNIMVEAIETYLHDHAAALGLTWEEFCIQNEL